eukprot:Blabericola_migrator_1__4089@NODE_2246_length_3061_cov_217_166333_g1414_i0_p3_GENE_NODE_2246_length_3061_cov_217_166333_g1414_i0NODE_2246_length_3061_cov_217_166333_g1414_i0_p3_ORF_typecomplete_len103_score12_14Leader_Trp/PF08255_11/2_1_NODE_2246_length_3061_cov_217_166333_g1414_i026672975
MAGSSDQVTPSLLRLPPLAAIPGSSDAMLVFKCFEAVSSSTSFGRGQGHRWWRTSWTNILEVLAFWLAPCFEPKSSMTARRLLTSLYLTLFPCITLGAKTRK